MSRCVSNLEVDKVYLPPLGLWASRIHTTGHITNISAKNFAVQLGQKNLVVPSHAHIRSAKFSCATKNHGYTHTHHILCTTFLQLRSKKIHTIHSNNDNKVTTPTPTPTHACKVESQNTKNTFLRSHGYTIVRALWSQVERSHTHAHTDIPVWHTLVHETKRYVTGISGEMREKRKLRFFFFV